MKIRLLPLLFLLSLIVVPTVSSDVSIEFTPEPQHGQLWTPNEYLLTLTGPVINFTEPEYGGVTLSGNLIYNVSIQWRGSGQYFHGGSSTGYSYNSIYSYYQQIESISKQGTIIDVSFDRTSFPRVKPFEEVHLTFKIDVFLEVVESGENITGPLIETKSRTLILADDEKIEYLQDKLEEIEGEVNLVLQTEGLSEFNRSKYSEYLTSMNQSLSDGDYSEALNQWEKWDKKERLRMYSSYVQKVEDQTTEYETLLGISDDLEILQTEYDHLNDKYVAIFKEKNQNLVELEATKQGLSTAITGVFLSAIVFFFLGRRTNPGENM